MANESEFDPGDMLRRMERALTDTTPMLNAIGAMLASRAQMAFQKQGRGGKPWPARHVPNVPGIIADLKAGRTPPERRFQPRPAAIDTGRLLADISHQIVGKDTVQIGTLLPYAGTIQYGGDVDIPVPPQVKEALAKWLDSLDRSAARAEKRAFGSGPSSGNFGAMAKAVNKAGVARRALGYLLSPRVKGITWHVPARPFVGVFPEDVADIHRLIREGLFDPRKRRAA